MTIAAFLLFAVLSTSVAAMPSPFFDFSAADSIETDGTDSTGAAVDGTGSTGDSTDRSAAPVGYLVYILLSGMLGASLFGLRSLRRRSASAKVPQYLTGLQISVARLLVGAGSALAVFFLLRAELFAINVGAGIDSGPFLVSIAFVAGYSERLVHTTVESVASTTDSELPDS